MDKPVFIPRRRCGNTIRTADWLIQQFFEVGEIHIDDHPRLNGESKSDHYNSYLLNMIVRRLKVEHGYVSGQHYKLENGTIPVITRIKK